jgi:YVTN family beta-propeller protein
MTRPRLARSLLVLALATPALAGYTNFEVSHVHPLRLAGSRLLAVNTPDARLEVFSVAGNGTLTSAASVPVGLEPVSVTARTDAPEAWVVNQLSDSVSVVDLTSATVVRTLRTGDEPSDVAFAAGRAFVAIAGEDALEVFSLANLGAAPQRVPLFGRKPRALAVSLDGTKVYAVVLHSGNRTTVVNAGIAFNNSANLDPDRLAALGLEDVTCDGAPPPYPPLPSGVTRNPSLPTPRGGTIPRVGLIVRWNESAGRWEDEAGQDWTHCLPLRLPDHDLFVIDAATLAVSQVDHLGTSLFEVSVQPASGRIWVPHTEARNFVRFEHPLGVQGHVVDNRVSVVDPAAGWSVQTIELNTHVNRSSNPATNLLEREASISQPGMLVWNAAGTTGWLTALGSRRVFRVNGACSSGSCIFGANRAAPAAVEVGQGPTGVALHESSGRLFVLNRFGNSIATVDTASLTRIAELPLHDASSPSVRDGRRFLYDAILGSGHGDGACSSCHLSGDRDDLAWDLGNPAGDFALYSRANDNVRFIIPSGNQPLTCDASFCAAQDGFDPQKGPMTTQTLRGMLEPLHWRGDRGTMNNFNQAFPGLMGTADIGPIGGEPAGLTAQDMERFRQFALGIRYPPNPHRNVDDTLPNVDVLVRGSRVPGNPTVGETIFNTFATDAGQACRSCHAHPFGAAGGALGGVTPTEPTSPQAAALFNGNADQSVHSDVKVAQLRNMYEKMGPEFGDHVSAPPESVSGFGFGHDGSVPDLATFFSFNVFTMSADEVADVSAFTTHFPTGTRPAVGQNVTLPAGAPPTGPQADEDLLSALVGLGNESSPSRHCELVATTIHAGRPRSFLLSGGAWVTDVAGETPLSTTALRVQASAPLSFLCTPVGSGRRLGGDRDEDARLDGNDCAAADAGAWSLPGPAAGVVVQKLPQTHLAWSELASANGPATRYDVLGGNLSGLRTAGLASATSCAAGSLAAPSWDDLRPAPPPGDARYYIVRGTNSCGPGSAGAGRESLAALACPAP